MTRQKRTAQRLWAYGVLFYYLHTRTAYRTGSASRAYPYGTAVRRTRLYYLWLLEDYESQNEPLDVPGRQIRGQNRILRRKMGLETLG